MWSRHQDKSSEAWCRVSDRDSVRALVRATRTRGLAGVVQQLRVEIDADVGLFDLNGNTLAAAPTRVLWDYRSVVTAAERPASSPALLARRVFIEGEPAALIAVNTGTDPHGLLTIAEDLISIEVARVRAQQKGRRELTQHMVEDLIASRTEGSEAQRRLEQLGFTPDQDFRALLGRADIPTGRTVAVPWNIHAMLGNREDPFVRVVIDNALLMLVPDDAMVEQISVGLLRHMSAQGSDAAVGVSSPSAGPLGVRVGYFEALSAALSGPGIRHTESVDLADLLIETNVSVPLADIAMNLLRPLLDYDRDNGTELVRTLRAYLEADRNVGASAAVLYVHRNTLRYRLHQIEELLGVSLSSTRAFTNSWLAIQSLRDGQP